MAVTFRQEHWRWLADRIWKFDQVLWALALPALITLKLTGVVTWSWWWVLLLPLWISSLELPLTFSRPGAGAQIWNLGARVAVPALVVLKLTGVIAWSWWWVLAPLWICGIILVLPLCLLVAGIWWNRRNLRRSGGYPDEDDCESRSGRPDGNGWMWSETSGRTEATSAQS